MNVPVAALALALALQTTLASAAPARRVVSRRSAIRPAKLAKLLDRGDLAVVESYPNGTQKQLLMLSVIAAPPEQVYDAVYDVESYPKFMTTVPEAKIVRRNGPTASYEWELGLLVLTFRGVRAMRGKRPNLIQVRGVSGHFESAREAWELYPLDGGRRTLVALYRSVDVREGGLILKAAVKLEPSLDHGMNLAAAFVFLRDMRAHVEKLPPVKPSAKGPIPAFRMFNGTSDATVSAVRGLLDHGELALIESNGDGSLRQVTVLAIVRAPKTKLQAVVHAPEKWPEFIPNLTAQEVTRETDKRMVLDYELDVPLINIEGKSRLTIEPDGSVEMVAVSGDIKRARWRWEFHDLGEAASVPFHYAYSDVTETSWIIEKLVAKEPLFEHGIAVAASTVAVRAMKARAEGVR